MRLARPPVLALAALAAFSGVAAAQPQRVASVSPIVQFLFTLVSTLVVGGLTIAIAPRFADRVVAVSREQTLPAALIGVAVLVAELLVLFVASLFGPLVVLVAIPLMLFGAVGQSLAVVAIGRAVVEQFGESSNWSGLLVGTLLLALVGLLPVLGQAVWVAASVVGMGAIVRERDWA